MNLVKSAGRALAVISGIGLVASQAAAAGFCFTDNRPLPTVAGSVDSVSMSCNGTTALTVGEFTTASQKRISVLLQAGTGTDFARVDGMTNAGALIATCTATDVPPVNGSGVNDVAGCETAIRWRGQVKY